MSEIVWGIEPRASLICLHSPPIRARHSLQHPDNCVLAQTDLKQRKGKVDSRSHTSAHSPQWSASSCSRRGPWPASACRSSACPGLACPRSGVGHAWSLCPAASCRGPPCPHSDVWSPESCRVWWRSAPGGSGQTCHCGNQSWTPRNIPHSPHLDGGNMRWLSNIFALTYWYTN